MKSFSPNSDVFRKEQERVNLALRTASILGTVSTEVTIDYSLSDVAQGNIADPTQIGRAYVQAQQMAFEQHKHHEELMALPEFTDRRSGQQEAEIHVFPIISELSDVSGETGYHYSA